MRLIFLAFGLLLSISAAKSQSLEEVDRRQAAVIEAWEKTPLTVRQAAFSKGEPRGYGLYDEHASSEFKKGERVIAYAEPVGYGWKENGKGLFEIRLCRGFSDQVARWRSACRRRELHADRDGESSPQRGIFYRPEAEYGARPARRVCPHVQAARYCERQAAELRDAYQAPRPLSAF